MDAMNSGDESEDEPVSTEMLEDIYDGIKSRLIVNKGDTRYKIRYHIKRGQPE